MLTTSKAVGDATERTNDDNGTTDDRIRYGHALRVLAILLRHDEPPERVADRIDQLADEVETVEPRGSLPRNGSR